MKERTINLINEFMQNHSELKYLEKPITESIKAIVNMEDKNKIMLCGNGGSAADCEHIAGEFLKSFVLKRKLPHEKYVTLKDTYGEDGELIADNLQQGIKAIPLTSFCAYNTAFLNDCNEKMLYAQLVNSLGIKGDILIAISTSGNSKNVVYASMLAKTLGIKVIALTGETGGKLKNLADILIDVPSSIVYKVQEYHLPIYHLICLGAESELFEE